MSPETLLLAALYVGTRTDKSIEPAQYAWGLQGNKVTLPLHAKRVSFNQVRVEYYQLTGIVLLAHASTTAAFVKHLPPAQTTLKALRTTAVVLGPATSEINRYYFADFTFLTQIALPDTIQHIRDGAFVNCSSLQYIHLPQNITELCRATFEHCTSLQTLTLPDTVWAIRENAMLGCSALRAVLLPHNLKHIGTSAFAQCTALTSMCIPDAVTCISPRTFYLCTALLHVTMPVRLLKIMNLAFYCCRTLVTVRLPETLTFIGSSVFKGCVALQNVCLPSRLRELGEYAFQDCTALDYIDLSHTQLSVVSAGLFRGCTTLRTVHLSPDTIHIGNAAFADCNVLVAVPLSNHLLSIGTQAFQNTGITTLFVPQSVRTVGKMAYKNCIYLRTATLSTNIEYVAQGTFEGCTLLARVHFNRGNSDNGPHSLGQCAFGNCSKLTAINIPSHVSQLGANAFHNCVMLQSIQLPDQLYDIQEGCFSGCLRLQRLDIPPAVVCVGAYCFLNCTTLQCVTMSSNLSHISQSLFENCTSLKTLTLPTTVKVISNRAFAQCSSLETVHLGPYVYWIGLEAFANCALRAFTLPKNVTTLRDSCFKGCAQLLNADLHCALTDIGCAVFWGCRRLRHLYIPSSVRCIDAQAFAHCSQLDQLSLAATTQFKTDDAFDHCDLLQCFTLHVPRHPNSQGHAICTMLSQRPIVVLIINYEGLNTHVNIKLKACAAYFKRLKRVWTNGLPHEAIGGLWHPYTTFKSVPRAMKVAPVAQAYAGVMLWKYWQAPSKFTSTFFKKSMECPRFVHRSRTTTVWNTVLSLQRSATTHNTPTLPEELQLYIFTFLSHVVAPTFSNVAE
tara:strand:+ start:488 stop:3016 length:2529 start_codon:yes stop_codon:yes gene_type:complete